MIKNSFRTNTSNENNLLSGRLTIQDYGLIPCKMCTRTHEQPKNRKNCYWYVKKEQDGRKFIYVLGFQCKDKDRLNPLKIQIGTELLKSKSNWRYTAKPLKPTFFTKYILPIEGEPDKYN